jgi:hypothetical protein
LCEINNMSITTSTSTSSLDSFVVSKEAHIVTRHFYDRLSVQKALLSAVQLKHPLRKHLIAFWAHELFVSEEWDLLGQTLAHALLSVPPFPAVRDLWVSWDPRSLEFVKKVVSCLGFPLEMRELPSPFGPPPDTPCSHLVYPAKPAAWTSNQRCALQKVVQKAIQQRHGERVYRLLCDQPPAVALLYLDTTTVPLHLLEAYKSVKRGLQHIVCALGCSWNCLYEPEAAKWPSLKVGTRSARMFAVPAKYVYHSLDLGGLDILQGCAFWQRVLREHGVKDTKHLMFETDEAMETFYATYFPDDIPDEWSKEERQKSHRE